MDKLKIFGESKGDGLPTRLFADYVALGDGADRVELRYFGRGHTNGDAWVFFPALRVMHAGDIFPGKSAAASRRQQRRKWLRDAPNAVMAHADRSATWTPSSPGTARSMTPGDLNEWAEFNDDFLPPSAKGKAAAVPRRRLPARGRFPPSIRDIQSTPSACKRTSTSYSRSCGDVSHLLVSSPVSVVVRRGVGLRLDPALGSRLWERRRCWRWRTRPVRSGPGSRSGTSTRRRSSSISTSSRRTSGRCRRR